MMVEFRRIVEVFIKSLNTQITQNFLMIHPRYLCHLWFKHILIITRSSDRVAIHDLTISRNLRKSIIISS